MYIKMYVYYVDLNKQAEYKRILTRSNEIYKAYIDCSFMCMMSTEEPGKCIEIQTYPDEDQYLESQQHINHNVEIMELYKQFLSILAADKPRLREESYTDFISNQ